MSIPSVPSERPHPATLPRQEHFPDPRRIVTGHKADGSATVLSDSQLFNPLTPLGANMVELWQCPFPADNNDAVDPTLVQMFATGKGLARSDGVVLRVIDVPPNIPREMKFMHRTITLDFIILIAGTVTCVLDNDEEVTLKNAGDVLIQRGTIHGWYNETDKPCRFYAVLIGSNKVSVDGVELQAEPAGVSQ